MEKYLQAKKKNHYVWRKYLQNWTVDGNVYYLTKTNKIGFDSPKGMCRENGFYKINCINENDLAYINAWVEKCPDHLQRIHKETIEKFLHISKLINEMDRNKGKSLEVDMAAEALKHNCLEDLYCSVENGAHKSIEGLSEGNLSVLDNLNYRIGLYSYLGHQIMRTKAIKERFFAASSSTPKIYVDLVEKNWWLISYILGTNIGWSLYESRGRDSLLLVENKSAETFITGDCPVINVHPEVETVKKGSPVESLDLYFPVSPKYALMICSSKKWGFLENGADSIAAKELNLKVAENAKYSIFAVAEELVKVNKHRVGSW